MSDHPAATESAPIAAATEAVFQVPKDTTPTWEVELLLSGALVFSMLQVPGLLDDLLYSLRPRLTGSLNYGAFMLYFYLKITSYALIGTFVLHLASRAVWVAALGLRSVYPGGVDWDKLSRGPIYREYAKRTTLTLDQMIDRADNRASLVFAFGLLLVLMSLSIMLFTMVLVVVGEFTGYFMVLVMLLVVPTLLATLVDRYYGERIPSNHRLAAVIRGFYRASAWMIWGRVTNPILLTLFSRIGMRRGNLLMMGALYSLMALVLFEVLVRAGEIPLPGERYLPDHAQGRELRTAHYAESRSREDELAGLPYISAELSRDPYLRLFVPYLPRRVDAAIERDCPAAAATAGKLPRTEREAALSARTAALLDCAATRLFPATLDGTTIVGLRYDIAADPRSGLRGFVAMIDVRDLPLGRHQLSIAWPQREGDDDPAQPIVIPFWR